MFEQSNEFRTVIFTITTHSIYLLFAPRMEGGGLTTEQFARTRKPFDYPVITRHEVKRGNGAILQELNNEEVSF